MGAIDQTQYRLAFWRVIDRTGNAGKTRVYMANMFGGDAVHLQDHVENFSLDQLWSTAILAKLMSKLDIKGKQRIVAITCNGVYLGGIQARNTFGTAGIRLGPLVEGISPGVVHGVAFLIGEQDEGDFTSG